MNNTPNYKGFYEATRDLSKRIYLEHDVDEYSWTSIPHYHNAAELSILLKGKLECIVNGEIFEMQPGEIVFIDSFDVHYFKIAKDCERLAVVVDRALLSSFYALYGEKGKSDKNLQATLPRKMASSSGNADVADLVFRWINSYDTNNELQDLGYINLMFGTLANRYGTVLTKNVGCDSSALDMLAYIEKNFKEEITLELLAETFFVSKNTVSRTLHMLVGEDLRTYIARIRMRNACKLLAENKKMTVQEAAFASGFKSMNTFYRNYQKQNGGNRAGIGVF